MILQSLVDYYEVLVRKEKAVKPGWCKAKVSYALNLFPDGTLKGIFPLQEEQQKGKKTVMVPLPMNVPEMVSRSSGISANFLCDNSKYFLGIDANGSGGRVKDCFLAARERHLEILKDAHSPMAEAVKGFFACWKPDSAADHPMLQEVWDAITAGGNLVFSMGVGNYAQDDPEIQRAWESAMEESVDGDQGICLVTGKKGEISRIHTAIKGVQGAQSSGAALVSFNASAFESYGKEQGQNAPVGKYAAFAYTTALNTLLADEHAVFRLGDTTIVFWSQDAEPAYQNAFLAAIQPQENNEELIRGILEALEKGKALDLSEIQLDADQPFFILGLAPNAARLSVRFFWRDSFGNVLRNLSRHYKRMEIVRPSWDQKEYLGVWRMLYETVNQKAKDKKPLPNMAALTFQAILSDSRYPESLYENVLIRIRAEAGRVTRGRAAIIKACLIKNYQMNKGDDAVKLNEERNDAPYVLGRLFAELEAIQEEANPGINATIHDKYFNSACATPATIFPILLKLKDSHIKKLARKGAGYRISHEKKLTDLAGRLEEFPAKLNLKEQGDFILGYYHQVQKRYEKKEEKE